MTLTVALGPSSEGPAMPVLDTPARNAMLRDIKLRAIHLNHGNKMAERSGPSPVHAPAPQQAYRAARGPEYGEEQTKWDLHAIGIKMKAQVGVKDHKGFMKVHEQCFLGTEAVQWFTGTGLVASIEEALELGHAMMSRGMFWEINQEHLFRNKPYLYRFAEDEFNKLLVKEGKAPPERQHSYDELAALQRRMRVELAPGERELKGRKHQLCFQGDLAWSWFQHTGQVASQKDATNIGNELMLVGLIQHVQAKKTFRGTKGELYRYSEDIVSLIQRKKQLKQRTKSEIDPDLMGEAESPMSSRGSCHPAGHSTQRSMSVPAISFLPASNMLSMLEPDSDEEEDALLEGILEDVLGNHGDGIPIFADLELEEIKLTVKNKKALMVQFEQDMADCDADFTASCTPSPRLGEELEDLPEEGPLGGGDLNEADDEETVASSHAMPSDFVWDDEDLHTLEAVDEGFVQEMESLSCLFPAPPSYQPTLKQGKKRHRKQTSSSAKLHASKAHAGGKVQFASFHHGAEPELLEENNVMTENCCSEVVL